MSATGAQRGVVLIIVLWVLALLMLLLAAFSTSVRVDSQLAAEVSQRVRARAAADAALAYLAGMQRLGGDTWGSLAGQVLVLPLDDERVRFRLLPEEAYLSLTGAPPELLEPVIAALAGPQADVALAVSSLMARRLPKQDGQQVEKLRSVGELLQLPGFDRALVERLSPLVTVDTDQPGVFLPLAPQRLGLLLLAGDRRLYDAIREGGGEALGVPPGVLVSPGGRVFRLQVEVGEGRDVRKVEVTIVFGEGDADYQIVRRNEYNPAFYLD
ncbi:hypothetical protein JLK41_02985 [Ectopseudomonas khazarica]|uniref:hypothetical protein n=1 Tax=Ectopseudomonas khazarica TaxID=2502979 RepID=UPI0006482B48|nr:hypothetical protein [Pseudomonas khazarica]QTS87153.1 hypothetical protein JLK41_02985 [Pseudomonas khazarica]